ncbi:MAG: HDIG domain-containing protein [Deltaproteobacteria bacterium]|jgi:putative nucleotidyltransferase with HDIG domain|nr:HDIG domain-containing protein [Deltaproteobacteria bacterium]
MRRIWRPAPRKEGGAQIRGAGRGRLFSGLARSLEPYANRAFLARAALVALVAVATAFLAKPATEDYQVGAVANRTIRAGSAVSVPDPKATLAARREAGRAAVPLFILDDNVASATLASLRSHFRRGRQFLALGLARFPDSFARDFNAAFPAPPGAPLGLLERLRDQGFTASLEARASRVALEFFSQGLLDDRRRETFAPFRGRDVDLFRVGAPKAAYPFDSFLYLSDAYRQAERRAQLLGADLSEAETALCAELVRAALRDNLIFDEAAQAEAVLRAEESVAPIVYHVAPGEIIAREGEIVSESGRLKLAALEKERQKTRGLSRAAGLALILVVFLAIVHAIAGFERRGPATLKEGLLMALSPLMCVLMAWSSQRLGQGLSAGFAFLAPHTVFLAMPIPAAAMLSVIFLGNRRAIPLAFLGALLGAGLAPIDAFQAFIYLANGSLIAILHLRHISERGRFIPSSVTCGLAGAVAVLGKTLMDGGPLLIASVGYDLGAAVLSGILSGILASGLVPVIETVLGLTTNLKLMELGNLNRPLLRDLMVMAPGTYHHSVIVGGMVEAAAEAIGANPHLARVGAYYHDIGKIRKPLYFIENQGGENRHDNLTPTMSVLLLVGHVKDGVEIARKHKLPQGIIDIVEQHHGTSLMSYFYHKASEKRGARSQDVNEGDFRYHGPKPASKEAGLVMLADVCEAATRSLTEPTPSKIADLVDALVNRIFDDGQLDASELVLKDLVEAKKVFANILVGIYHHRISYPTLDKKASKDQADRSEVIYGHLNAEPGKQRLTH